MPRKTRSEKILAKLRRLENQQVSAVPSPVKEESEETVSSPKVAYEFKPNPISSPSIQVKTSVTDYSYVYKDLRKTVFFAVAAVTFEILLRVVIFK